MFLLYFIYFSLLSCSNFLLWLSPKSSCCCFGAASMKQENGIFPICPAWLETPILACSQFCNHTSWSHPSGDFWFSSSSIDLLRVYKFKFPLPWAELHMRDPSSPWLTQNSPLHLPLCRLKRSSLSVASLCLILFHYWFLLILLLGFLGNWSLLLLLVFLECGKSKCSSQASMLFKIHPII